MFTAEQVRAMISVVEAQRAAATEQAIQTSVRVVELERQLAEANKELATYRPAEAGA
jgi:hypothetical protein